MRIIAGTYKGHKLDYDKSKELRPTQDRVKEALFSILGDRCDQAVCLDLFAGSGSLGLEALSRGASHVDLVDTNIQFAKKNKQKLGDPEHCHCYGQRALAFLKRCTINYDLIFLDPPWTKETLFSQSLKAIFDFDILSEHGLIVCEHPDKIRIETGNVIQKKQYSDTCLSFIIKETHE